MKIVLSIMLLITSLSFALGVTLPIVHFEKLYLFSETPSLINVVTGLYNDSNVLLATIIAIFSIVFPLTKLALVYIGAIAPTSTILLSKAGKWITALSKWSMMDVILVALVIFAAKSSGLATAVALPGIWFYAVAALGGTLSAEMLRKSNFDQDGSRPSGS